MFSRRASIHPAMINGFDEGTIHEGIEKTVKLITNCLKN